jgi:hypothetical protein
MVRVIFGNAVAAKVMVLPTGIEKLIVCGAAASALALVIACRRVPGPLSAVLDTVNTVAQSDPEVRNNRNEKTKTFFSKQQVISEASSDAIFLINEVVNIKFMRLSLNFGYLNVKALSMIHQFFVFEKLCLIASMIF